MKNFRKLFEPWILERGMDYAESGRVMELNETDSLVRAKVRGMQLYQVEIHKTEERVSSMYCDCPYAADGENCKHMAAVLLSLEERPTQTRIEWQTALGQMREPQLRGLVHSLAIENEALQDRIVRIVSGAGSDPDLWEKDLERIVSEYDDYGWLDYDRAYDCMCAIAEYLEESLPALLNDGQVVASAKLVLTVYDTAWSQDMDDSCGGLSIVSQSCQDAMEKILSLADPQQEREIFAQMHALLNDDQMIDDSDDLEHMIISLNWSPELQQQNLDYLDENLSTSGMFLRADLMERMGASKGEVIAWWEQHRDNSTAYHPLLKLYQEENLPKAIELVRERREQKNNTPRQIECYTQTLLQLLEKSEDREAYENELRYLVLKLNCREIEYVAKLKDITPPEMWHATFEMLVGNAKYPPSRMELYHLEGMYNELFKELCQYYSICNFLRYEEDLRKWDAERTLKLYVAILKGEMAKACDRTQYRNVASYLKNLNAYPRGQEEANALAAYWYIQHKNRPAMKDELNKAGYPQKI